jgi:porin
MFNVAAAIPMLMTTRAAPTPPLVEKLSMRRFATRLAGPLVLCILLLNGRSLAYDLMTAERLTGDWGGTRAALDAHGLNLDLVYTGDVVANVRGGVTRQTNYLDNIDLTLTCRLVELTGWDLGSLFLYGLSNHGGNPSEAVGNVQGVDNIEAPEGTQLYEAWWQKTLLSNRLSALVGLYDVNSEFDVISSAAVFLNSSFGTGPELSHSGRNGPSVFPATALAARFKDEPLPHLTLQAAAVDGVPANPSASLGDKFSLSGDQGAMLIGEATYYWGRSPSSDDAQLLRVQRRRVGRGWGERPYALKVALGVWGYTAPLPQAGDPSGTRTRRGHPGVYLLAEYDVSALDPLDARGLAVFMRLGWADEQVQQISGYTGAGLVYTGLLPPRPNDRTGFGVAVAYFGGPAQDASASEAAVNTNYELDLEWTYRFLVTPWLALQPDVQWVRHPGGTPGRPDAIVLGVRTEITF